MWVPQPRCASASEMQTWRSLGDALRKRFKGAPTSAQCAAMAYNGRDMRRASLFLVLWLGGLTGCKGNGEPSTLDPAALREQQELLARRDKLLETRQRLEAESQSLGAEISDIEARGGDASAKKKQKDELDRQLNNVTAKAELDQLNSKLDLLRQTGDNTAQLASREANLAGRERTLAEREARLAERERQLVDRDAELAQRWKDGCQLGAPVIIQQAAKGGNYTKKDVSDLIARAKARMARKGILTSDLPGPAQGLEVEASQALNDNDMGKAYFAASQLVRTVDSIQVNRAFLQAKMARVQAQIKSSKPDPATNQQLSGILSEVIQKFGDGDFAGANTRLNQLVSKLK